MSYLVGRESELNSILSSIDKIIKYEEAKHVIFITGEAGIGKSTLVEALKKSLSERGRFLEESQPLIAYAACTTPIAGHEIGSAEALKPWTDIFQKLAVQDTVDINEKKDFDFKKFMVDTAPSWMKLIPVIGSTLEGAMEIGTKAYSQVKKESVLVDSQQQIFQQYINFLTKLSEHNPLVLIIDDFHWADDSSANLLFTAARQLSAKPIIFIVTYRAEEVISSRDGKGHPIVNISDELERYDLCERIALERFTFKQTEDFLSYEYKNGEISRDKNFIDWLMRVSEGNALYIVNFLAKLEEEGFVEDKTGKILKDYTGVKAPEGNLALIRSRLKNLPEEEKEVLRYASVEGSTFTMEVLSEILEEKPLKLLQKLRLLQSKSALIESLGKLIIHTKETTAYKFSHVQIYNAMYESLEEEERELLHEAVFKVLEDEWQAAKESGINIVNIGSKIAIHANALEKNTYAAEALLEAARESWTGYAADETMKLLEGVFSNLDKAEKQKKDKEKIISLKIEAMILKSNVYELRGLWKECVNIYNSSLSIAENLSDGIGKKKFLSRINAAVGNVFRLLGDYNMALNVFETSLALSKELNDKFSEAYAIGNIGVINFNKGNYEKAWECYKRKLLLSEELNDEKGIANVMGNMGNLYYAQGEYDEAMKCHNKKLSISEELGDRRNIAFCVSNIGSIYYDRGDYEEALKYFNRKLSISEQLGDKINISTAFGNIGNVYYAKGDFENAIKYQKIKLAMGEELSDLQSIARANGNLAVVYLKIREFDKSLECCNKALAIAEQLGDKQMLARATGVMGAAYSGMNNSDKAIECYKKELLICEELGDKLNIGVSSGNLGNNYFRKGKLSEAYSHLTRAIALHRQLGYIEGLRTSLWSMSKVYLEEYEKAEKIPSYLENTLSDSNWREMLLDKADELATEANGMLFNQITHAEDITYVKIQFYRIKHIRGNDSEIKEELKELLKSYNDYYKADILYWLWKLSADKNEKLKFKEEAIVIYDKLFAETNEPEFKELSEELRNS